jgi:excinuclease ABC subunit A
MASRPKTDAPPPHLQKKKSGYFTTAVPSDTDYLVVEGLRQNNLKNLNLKIPHDKITAIVGPSGSGKSSLAFDTLFAEGRWRFMESLSTYTRLFMDRMDRPDLDAIRNIRPAIAVEQRNPVRTSRSTLGTMTELNDVLRLLFSRIGKIHCPECSVLIKVYSPTEAAEELLQKNSGSKAIIGFTLNVRATGLGSVAEELLRKGFLRIRTADGLRELSAHSGEETTEQTEYVEVVADRLKIKPEELTRLTEAIETSYREGNGETWVEIVDNPEKSDLRFSERPRCLKCDVTVERPSAMALSFNHPVGACTNCKGFGNVQRYDIDKIVPNRALSLDEGAIEPWTKPSYRYCYDALAAHAKAHNIPTDIPFGSLGNEARRLIFEGTDDFEGVDQFFEALEVKKYKLHIKVFTSRYKSEFTCTECNGARLKKSALSVKIDGHDISEVSRMSIEAADRFIRELKFSLLEQRLSATIIANILEKLQFLKETGLGYLTINRPTRTLSGGEAQRVAIATQLSATLTGVLYILDEPSIGLHPVDVDKLAAQLRRLCDRGNTIVVVEHDPTIIENSDHIVELGPGAGERGGRLVASGPTTDFLSSSNTITADYLTGRKKIHIPRWRRKGDGSAIVVKGARGNNLKEMDISIPLKTMTAITGVSGSGKSSIIVDTLYNLLAANFDIRAERPLEHASIEGMGLLSGVRLVDQSPIGRTPRSNPITYIGGFDEIRSLFAALPMSRSSGLKPGHFSFNVNGGRCDDCKGEGVQKLEMYFLPDVYIKCPTCNGKRYRPKVLRPKYRGKNIFECLNMTFDEASQLFSNELGLQKRFSVVKEVGLGYLKLGQSATTLSGGEAQRLKIGRELIEKKRAQEMLYIFDEPTTGLHMSDVKRLLSVLGRLVDSGNTVVMIEHNLDCIKTADWVIDIGPAGGMAGGNIVATGPPEKIAANQKSLTGRYLSELIEQTKEMA